MFLRRLFFPNDIAAAFLLAAGCFCVAPVRAELPILSNGPAWIELSPPQRTALAPLQPQWVTFDTESKRKWLEVASRFPKMSADQRQRVQLRMSEWVQMTPAQRNVARWQFQDSTKSSSEAERLANWKAYQELPTEQRKALAERARERNVNGTRAPNSNKAGAKANILGNPYAMLQPPRLVAPAVEQGNPGVTTFLMPFRPVPPLHQQAGMPKIATLPDFIDARTLLPLRGPQGAAAGGQRALSASK